MYSGPGTPVTLHTLNPNDVSRVLMQNDVAQVDGVSGDSAYDYDLTTAGFDGECLDKFSGRYSTIARTKFSFEGGDQGLQGLTDTLETCISFCGETEVENKDFQVGFTYVLFTGTVVIPFPIVSKQSECICHYDDAAEDLTDADDVSIVERGGSGSVAKGDGTGNSFTRDDGETITQTRKCYPSQVRPCFAKQLFNSKEITRSCFCFVPSHIERDQIFSHILMYGKGRLTNR